VITRQALDKHKDKQIDQFAPERQADKQDKQFKHLEKKGRRIKTRTLEEMPVCLSMLVCLSFAKEKRGFAKTSSFGACLRLSILGIATPGITDLSLAHGRQCEGLPLCRGLRNHGRSSGQRTTTARR
jgi:hypothetical protein